MPDTRNTHVNGIPGFNPGQQRWNATNQFNGAIGGFDWNIHATIESTDSIQGAKKVRAFHVSLYSDGVRWGGFYWSFNFGNDSYSGGAYEGQDLAQDLDAADLGRLLARANTQAQRCANTFGSTGIAAAAW